jgi:REP element-mobilizing transposase RayT
MMMLKGVSSRRVFERFPELKLDAGTNSLWQAGYGSKIIPPRDLSRIRAYIKEQWDHLESYAQ